MKQFKRIAVYYREIPSAIDLGVAVDTQMKLLKDGIFTHNGIKCPRATITMEWSGSEDDKRKLQKWQRLLEELESNNQIVAFSIR